MHCFGVASHSPDQALQFLLKRKIVDEVSDVAIVPSGTVLKTTKKPVRKIVFILSITDFYRNLATLNSDLYRDVQLFVFASPLRVAELSNTVFLDFESNPANKGLSFLLKKEFDLVAYRAQLKRDGNVQVMRQATKYLTVLTDSVKQGSLLNPLMTFLYTLPSSTHQTPVKEAVALYLYKGTAWSGLETMLDEIKGVIISKRIRDRLKEILVSDAGNNIRAAFKVYRAGKKAGKVPLWASLSKAHSVSEYEMRYIRSIIEQKLTAKPFRGKALNAQVKKAA